MNDNSVEKEAMSKESPCSTCCNQEICAIKCKQFNQWVSESWSAIRNTFASINN